jgi:ribonuclease BN (tRNA processing enzyme)
MANNGDVVVRSIGTGDAFGTGGRFQSCFLIRQPRGQLLIDCGASSLIAMRRCGENPSDVDAVVVSHLHGDHFGGIPFLILDQHFSKRDRPLLLAGPPGLEDRVWQASEVLFPGSSTIEWRYRLEFVVLPEERATHVAGVEVTSYAVAHSSGAPAYALRMKCADRVIAYSGDTEWVPALADAARDADLFICEAYTYETRVRYHLSYGDLRTHGTELNARRIVLTHPGPDLLAHSSLLAVELADDGHEFSL